MPNLEADPQNPSDLLGQPIAVGDIVAWGTNFDKSAALCVAEIEGIQFKRRSGEWNGYNGNKIVPQADAEFYTLRLRPIKSTGSVTWINKETGKEAWWPSNDPNFDWSMVEAKIKTIQHVKNIVKLDPSVIR